MSSSNIRQTNPDDSTQTDRRSNVLTTSNPNASNVLTTTDDETSASKDGPHQGRLDTGGYVPTS